MEKEYTLTGTLHPSKKAIEELRKLANKGDERVICVQTGRTFIEVATITRNRDCPKELFDQVINQLINGETK